MVLIKYNIVRVSKVVMYGGQNTAAGYSFLQVSCLVIVLCRPSTETSVSLKAILSVGLALVALWTVIGWILVCQPSC